MFTCFQYDKEFTLFYIIHVLYSEDACIFLNTAQQTHCFDYAQNQFNVAQTKNGKFNPWSTCIYLTLYVCCKVILIDDIQKAQNT